MKINKKESVIAYDKLQIHEEGRIYKTTLTEKFKNRQTWKEADLSEIKSVIPGSVLNISVNVGDKVNAGDKVMLYVAMKMHNIIRAPFDGIVSQILVKVGDKLPKNVLMMMIEPIEEEIEPIEKDD